MFMKLKGHLTIERQLGYLIIVTAAVLDLLFDYKHDLATIIVVITLVITVFAPVLFMPLTRMINKVSDIFATLSKYVLFGIVYFGPISFVGLIRLFKRRGSKKSPIESRWTHQTTKADKNFFEDMF